MKLITARDPRGCYGCGRGFARGEWPTLDKLDRRWHMICFIRDRSAMQDPAVANPHPLIVGPAIVQRGRRRIA